jgi:alpha-glucosidase (family GH31 glycosyl hydrolase)
MFMIENFLGKPADSPDLLMMQKPIFTTWSYFFRHINQSVVLNYAKEISGYNFSVSQIEIDDLWENKYGDLDFDKTKFPDPEQMVSQMHSMNQRVTLWIHPFCNVDSENFAPGVENNYWVKDSNGVHPGFTSWWNGQNAVILDTTNPSSCNYFTNKLNSLKAKYSIDSFKFDAGKYHYN